MSSSAIVSLFSGAGGLSQGFRDAGYPAEVAIDVDPLACESYRTNQDTRCITHNLSLGLPHDVNIRGCFVLIGGPPCQGFSTAGTRRIDDPRNELIFRYLDIVAHIRPKWFLFENVEGLLTANSGRSIAALVREFLVLGYWIRLEKVNFASYGLPQSRRRVIIVGNRLGIDFNFPRATHGFEGLKHKRIGSVQAPSIVEALAGLPGAPKTEADIPYESDVPESSYDALMRAGNSSASVTLHVDVTPCADARKLTSLLPGQSMKDLPEHLWTPSFRSRRFRRVADGVPSENRGGPPAGIRRLIGSHVSLTITSAATREFGHPSEDRMLTLRECARLQSFRDGYRFQGPPENIATQIGNAFPPLAAAVFARAIAVADGLGGSGLSISASRARPTLLGFRLTEASGMSPALQQTHSRLSELLPDTKAVQTALFPIPQKRMSRLELRQRQLITKSRTAKPISLSDRELARLTSVLLYDLNRKDLIPTFCAIPSDYRSYYYLPLRWFRSDEQRPFDFTELFLKCATEIENFEAIFECLCELHKRRRKFELILQKQPLPTMDQVGRKGLLEFGLIESPALTSWLVWRKWLYDIDNRSAQETGYLFEPIIAAALGGKPYGSGKSPIKRKGDPTKGRQTDCVVDAEGERLAYEFKLRMTIAASGQGRFKEELDFAEDAKESGYQPILLVLDPTPSEKLTALVAQFERHEGRAYLGEEAWNHIAERAGPTMTEFIRKYIKLPIEEIDSHSESLLDIGLSVKEEDTSIGITLGNTSWTIAREEDPMIGDVDAEDEV